jgi:hypothetical protein
MERLQKIKIGLGWLAILPLRSFPSVVDWWLGPLTGGMTFCITLDAMRSRRSKFKASVAVYRHAEAA